MCRCIVFPTCEQLSLHAGDGAGTRRSTRARKAVNYRDDATEGSNEKDENEASEASGQSDDDSSADEDEQPKRKKAKKSPNKADKRNEDSKSRKTKSKHDEGTAIDCMLCLTIPVFGVLSCNGMSCFHFLTAHTLCARRFPLNLLSQRMPCCICNMPWQPV